MKGTSYHTLMKIGFMYELLLLLVNCNDSLRDNKRDIFLCNKI